MRDVRDWNKYVDLVGKTVSKRTPTTASVDLERPTEARQASASLASDVNGGSNQPVAPAISSNVSLPPRKGRGPRREETREELLSRLIDPTLTLEETAKILEVCPTTVRRYTNKGILPHERSQGNQRRFKLSCVLAFRDAQMRGDIGDEAVAE